MTLTTAPVIEHGTQFSDLHERMEDVERRLRGYAQETYDRVLPMRGVTIGHEPRLGLTLTVSGMTLDLSRNARQQLAQWIELPNLFLDRSLAFGFGALAAEALSTYLDRANNKRPDWQMRFRIRRRNPLPVLRALVSERYGLFDNVEALQMVRENLPPQWGEALPLKSYGDPDTLRGTLIFPETVQAVIEDSDYFLGLYYRNSEIGRSAFGICPFLFRSFCTNSAIYDKRDAGAPDVRVVHLGEMGHARLAAIREGLLNGLELARNNGPNLLRLLGYTREVPVPDPRRMIASLTLQRNWGRETAAEWMAGYEQEPDPTAFGIVNGLTRAAQAFDDDHRLEMETAASLVMAPGIMADLAHVGRHWADHLRAADRLSEKNLRRLFPD